MCMYVCMSRKILSGFASLAASLAQKSRPALRLRLRAANVEVAGEAPSRRACMPCRSWNVFDFGCASSFVVSVASFLLLKSSVGLMCRLRSPVFVAQVLARQLLEGRVGGVRLQGGVQARPSLVSSRVREYVIHNIF